MTEWILVMSLFMQGAKYEVKDVAPVVITGFTSESTCMAAMNDLARELITQANKSREKAGLGTGRESPNAPNLNGNCLQIRK
jgi:hypothetical protein